MMHIANFVTRDLFRDYKNSLIVTLFFSYDDQRFTYLVLNKLYGH